eukprot:s4041_g6.t1
MPGTWHRSGNDLDLKIGSFVEGGVLDPEGRSQGTVILGIKEVGKHHGGAPSVEAAFIGCSDPHYLWWMEKGDGKDLSDRCWYHLCGERPGSCGNVRGKARMIHLTKVREVSPGDFEEGVLGFLKKKDLADAFDKNLEKFNSWVAKRGAPGRSAPAKGPEVRPHWHGTEESASSHEGDKREESPHGKKLLDRLEGLRKELRKAEKQAEDYRDRKRAARRGKSPPEKDGKKKKKKQKSTERRSKSPRGRSRSRRKKSRSRRRRSTSKEKSKSRRKRRKKKSTGSGDSGDESSSRSREGLFQAKQQGRSESPTHGDRGPFGEGPAVDFKDEDGSSSEESDFRKAPSKTTKSSQLKLLSYSRKYPGRLASRMLLKMAQATARGLEGAAKSKTPAVAMNHLLTVLQPSLHGKLGMRTSREMKTLAQCLDWLATGQVGRGADLLSQRLKALERATVETHWNSAQFLELLPPENATLLERDEEIFLAREYLTDQKIRGYDKPFRAKGWDGTKGGGKGKESQKGEKGKGKDKKARDKDEK